MQCGDFAMIQVIQFEKFHMDLISPREYEQDMIEFMGIDRFNSMVDIYSLNSKAFTAIKDGQVLCCGGVFKMWDKVGEVWIFSSEAMNENMFGMGRVILNCFKTQFEEFDRVQAAVKKKFDKATRLAEFVGMQPEGILRKFGPDGEDYVMYGRVK